MARWIAEAMHENVTIARPVLLAHSLEGEARHMGRQRAVMGLTQGSQASHGLAEAMLIQHPRHSAAARCR